MISTFPTHNNYIDLDVQEKEDKLIAEEGNNFKVSYQGGHSIQESDIDSTLLIFHNNLNMQKEQVATKKKQHIRY